MNQPGNSSSVGLFDGHTDVGNPKIAGTASYDPIALEYTLTAGGANVWAERDEFHFLWVRATGNFTARATVRFTGHGAEPHCKAGIMARPSFEDDAPYVNAALHRDGLTALQYRKNRGGASDHVVFAMRGATTILFSRDGDRYTFVASKSQHPPVTSDYGGVTLGNTIYLGLFLCSHNATVQEKAVFSRVAIEN